MKRVYLGDLTANTPEPALDSNRIFRPVGPTQHLPVATATGLFPASPPSPVSRLPPRTAFGGEGYRSGGLVPLAARGSGVFAIATKGKSRW